MTQETTLETQATELLRTLIRNGCVNTGDAASGHEERSVDALEDFFAGSVSRVSATSPNRDA